MNILNKIVIHKKHEVDEKKQLFPIKLLERSIYYNSKTLSLSDYIQRSDMVGIIAEFKRKSPSKGIISEYAIPEKVCLQYMQAGASALSVLTDSKFFGGSSHDLIAARKINFSPILQKDFIVDEYQIVEAKSIGADAILLIAEVLTEFELKHFLHLAHSLGLETVIEIHDSEHIHKLPSDTTLIGINNRDLKSFKVNILNSLSLIDYLPKNVLKIAESGISSAEEVVKLKNSGFNGFLIGERFMQASNPGKVCAEFIKQVKKMLS